MLQLRPTTLSPRLSRSAPFSITGTHDGGVPSQFEKPSLSTGPVYIKVQVNDQPTEAIVDTGSAITIIHQDLLKKIHHKKFIYKTRQWKTANSTPLRIIGQIELEIKLRNVKTYIIADVATNLITKLLLGNNWINSTHVHLFGDQQHLTIPDESGQLIRIPYEEPIHLRYPALLTNQVTLSPHSQALVEVQTQLTNAVNVVFEPNTQLNARLIFMPHTLLNISNNTAKILIMNAQNSQRTLSKHTKIGTFLQEPELVACLTSTQRNPNEGTFERRKLRQPLVLTIENNSSTPNLNLQCDECKEYFLSENDLQKHLRAKCYSDQIRQRIVESVKHIEDPKQRHKLEDILWRNKILFDPTPSIINIPPQSAIRTIDHPPIYSKRIDRQPEPEQINQQHRSKRIDRQPEPEQINQQHRSKRIDRQPEPEQINQQHRSKRIDRQPEPEPINRKEQTISQPKQDSSVEYRQLEQQQSNQYPELERQSDLHRKRQRSISTRSRSPRTTSQTTRFRATI